MLDLFVLLLSATDRNVAVRREGRWVDERIPSDAGLSVVYLSEYIPDFAFEQIRQVR